MAAPHTPRARSGPTAASAAPTATSTRTWCRRWTRRPCAPAWCGRHRPCSASARCTGEKGSPRRSHRSSRDPLVTVLPPQSLDDAELRMLGRDHTAAEARKAVEAARGLFPGRTSIDLLFGLPGQSRDAWAQRLEAILRLCDDHISLYQLTLERGTALAAQVRGGALPRPPQDLLADMYQTARNVLVAAGFRHYEVSNFARKGALSTHNLSYWQADQYIGVGPGAHGRFVPRAEGGCSREARVQTLEPVTWMREVQSQGHGTRSRAVLSPLEQLEELLTLGLRTDEGITHERWGHFSPQLSLQAVFGEPGEARALQQEGWLVLDGGGLRCTWAGLAVLDSLLPDLLWQLQRVLVREGPRRKKEPVAGAQGLSAATMDNNG
ncbi:radical S-adenosyl methionine domain-containing protein 1, mitochondrial isoform X3 [Haemorhous mexicanus]|uniref:radical S-adenosyl methionine domain-containing protein 1, mitochondrial isoform X3 n=1 Tax=Haemorhous mexicanus TaxID=30427 RepID=UPI0028BE5FA8|nr:radical S-adenosyl methionine domain-containing protein 1, mitochondrial isoform X3 [Haemorhous mexicanus]